MRALAHVAGPTLRTLDLGGYHTIGGKDMKEIVRVVVRACRNAKTLDVTGCGEPARLSDAATCAQSVFDCASLCELSEHLTAL